MSIHLTNTNGTLCGRFSEIFLQYFDTIEKLRNYYFYYYFTITIGLI